VSAWVLAIDLGKTGCRVVLSRGAQRLEARGKGAPGLASPDGPAGAEVAIAAVALPMLREAGVDLVESTCVGAAGALAAPEAARALARGLCLILPSSEVAVTSDAITSHAGALGGHPGVVLAAGTGAVAIAIGDDGVLVRADGWGPMLGDEGGGAWIGFQGLRAAMRAHDRRAGGTSLVAAATARFGALGDISAIVEGHPNAPQLVAGFALDVYREGVEGDAVAAEIIGRAGHCLAETVIAAAMRSRSPGMRFAAVGGLLELGPLLTRPILASLQARLPWLTLATAEGNALDGALLLARDRATVHEKSMVRIAAAPAAAPRSGFARHSIPNQEG
jgi:glucosamine kinase